VNEVGLTESTDSADADVGTSSAATARTIAANLEEQKIMRVITP
jgi:hypothetical protein